MAAMLKSRLTSSYAAMEIPPSKAEQDWAQIEQKYSEPQRHYHTLDHLTEMFDQMDSVTDHLHRPDLVSLAIIFHDVIYDPTKGDNEERSADLFTEMVQKASSDRDQVVDWILKTKSHQTEAHLTPEVFGTDDLHYFLDMDMAVLGRSSDAYKQYADEIRKEYIHIPDDTFRQRRAQVLREFLKVPNIYATKWFRTKLESTARANIEAEIVDLTS